MFYYFCVAAVFVAARNAQAAIDKDDPNSICKKRNAFYKVDASCDSYIECTEFVASKMTCPDGLHYNPEAKWPSYPCGYPMDVACQGRGAAQPAQPTEDCPHQYGYFPSPFASPDNCGQYRICVAGKSIEMLCAPGLAFSPDNSRCDWPELVPSCNVNEFLEFTCPAPPADADGQPIDIVTNYKYEGNCYYFFTCDKGRARLLSCDAGLAFDPASGRCVDADFVNCAVPA